MNRIILIFAFLCAAICLSAQKDSKDALDFLKGETQLNVIFDYSSVQIDGMPEEAFFNKMTAKDRKGNDWFAYWNSTIKERIFKVFCENANDEATGKVGISCGNYPSAKYEVVMKMLTIDDDGEFTALATFRERGTDTGLYSTKVEGSEGNGKFEKAIEESYEDGGENFGELLKKKLK